ncbi:class I SAM-dependent methyltransferase [Streptomyces sp. NBC_00091]|uniref:class I SAM-dependent methyltransferase n=1 Tax=Streptomyces sp. NBC_00091 TaxID=2975648 RepID=UPI00224F42AA|nr:class I SAM-dependent methyltransferase [Streptomyces sp. NBC_00091]MCX5380484.1 class I SAM-dependent methyltransferase [Streptomyces sp. NBC_00091]
MNTQQYDRIGARFEESKSTAAFSAADTHSLLLEIGDVQGLACLDLACGYGFNTRLLAERGARPAMGVDISPEMIRLARRHERERPLGTEYVVADVAAMPVLGDFDLATAVYLFNYAPARTALRAMFERIRANLTPTGRLVAIVPNQCPFPDANWDAFDVTVRERVPGGDAPLLKAAFLTEPPTPYEFYEWQHPDLERAARAAGFTSVAWRPITTPPADEHHDEALWTAYRATPVSSVLICATG